MSPDAAPEIAHTNKRAGDDDPPLRIALHATGHTLQIEVAGELDLNTTPRLQQALKTALTPIPEQLILDFRALDFIDSAGLALLIALHRHLRNHSPSLTLLVPIEGQVREVMELSHFGQFFHIENGIEKT